MLQLKSCGHCLGDLFEEEFLGQRELVCLQCGNRVSKKGLVLAPVRIYAQSTPQSMPRESHARGLWK